MALLQVALGFSLTDADLWARFASPPRGASFLARGLLGTLGYMALVIPLGFGIGFLWAWARLSRYRALSWPVLVLTEFLRGVPPLVLVIFAATFGATLLRGVVDNPNQAALLVAAGALALHSAAYQAEILRAGFQSVPRGQLEAAQALGMTPGRTMAHVILPQALRLSLPPLGNEFATVIKDTALLGTVGATELFSMGQDFLGQSDVLGRVVWALAVWVIIAAVYFAITFAVTRGLRLVERRLQVPGLEGATS
ncbi:MAG TPA: amino acid ABC transporter permease [Thermoplasmata archaeon]|nr:amino acid ABC transporter permease [Thermoplasmata archaeon]